jgi:asparagine synthase (glutamine-hydrolysing)
MKAFMGELVLTKIDRASMAHSLEVRVPFLDHELYEYVCRLHERRYFCANQTKRLLYELVKRHLPREILERKKQGFVGPDRYYAAIDFYTRAIYDGALLDEGLIRRDYVDQLVAQRDQWRLWKIMVFEYWYRRWVSDSPVPAGRRTDAATAQRWQSHDDGATVAYGAAWASGADRMLPLVAHDVNAPSAPLAK